MMFEVETLAPEGEEINAVFGVWRTRAGALRTQFIEAYMDEKPMGEIDLQALGVFETLREKAVDEFDDEMARHYDLEIEGDHALDLEDELAQP